MEDINVFKNIITTENLLTELFYYFLNYKVFRDSFLKLFLNDDKYNLIDYSDIETQYNTNIGIPDLAIINDSIAILCEIKISDTILTDNQPKGYIDYLNNLSTKEKWMIFLIHNNYNYINALKQYGFGESPCIIDYDINGIIIYWDDIMRIIEDNQLSSLNHMFSDFLGLLKMWYEIEEINFESGEIEYLFGRHTIDDHDNVIYFTNEEVEAMTQTNLIAKSFPKLIQLIDEIRATMTSKNNKSKFNDLSEEYGLYFKDNNGNDVLFFGIWFPFWEEYNKPLCFGVHKDYGQKVINRFKNRYPDHKPFKDWFLYWIDKDSFYKNIIEESKKEIEELLNYLLAKKNNEYK